MFYIVFVNEIKNSSEIFWVTLINKCKTKLELQPPPLEKKNEKFYTQKQFYLQK